MLDPSRLFVLVALSALLGGCIGNAATEAVPTESVGPRLGHVVGTVVDDEQSPVSNVSVAVEAMGAVATTDEGGRFDFRDLPEGTYNLVATHPQYEPTSLSTTILGELTASVDIVLVKLPAFRPHNLTTPYPGKFECAMEVLIVPGSCGIIIERATCDLNYCQPDPFEAKYDFKFDVGPRWETIIAEVTWESSANNLLDGMRLYLENTNVTEQGGHSVKVARVDGSEQPLALRVDRGTIHPRAETYPDTDVKAFIPDEGGREQVRVFPMGKAWDVTRQVCHERIEGCLLGVGAGLDVSFTVYVTIFYNEAAPQGFSYASKLR